MSDFELPRRELAKLAGSALGAGILAAAATPSQASGASDVPPVVYGERPRPRRRTGKLSIGCLIFAGLDQIDFTGPFEVFARIPDATVHVVAKSLMPIKDVKGLVLTPTVTIADAPEFDVLAVAGGLGQQALMDDPEIIPLIKRQAKDDGIVFSVCTGALLCGAAGILEGRKATTHWAALDLLPSYGAVPVDARVVVDGGYISTAGVTAGLDGALLLSSLLRGDDVAEEIQLDIQYAPRPLFHSGTPEEASADVIAAFFREYGSNKENRQEQARQFSTTTRLHAQTH